MGGRGKEGGGRGEGVQCSVNLYRPQATKPLNPKPLSP